MNLNGQAIGFKTPFTGPTLGDGCQYFQQQPCFIGCNGVAGVLFVDQFSAIQLKRQCAFAVGLLSQQHALDVCMLNDSNLSLCGIFDNFL